MLAASRVPGTRSSGHRFVLRDPKARKHARQRQASRRTAGRANTPPGKFQITAGCCATAGRPGSERGAGQQLHSGTSATIKAPSATLCRPSGGLRREPGPQGRLHAVKAAQRSSGKRCTRHIDKQRHRHRQPAARRREPLSRRAPGLALPWPVCCRRDRSVLPATARLAACRVALVLSDVPPYTRFPLLLLCGLPAGKSALGPGSRSNRRRDGRESRSAP